MPWPARGLHWRSSNVSARTIGAHEAPSTLRRRSRTERTKVLRDSAWGAQRAAQEARDAGQAAASAAARAALGAAGAAFLHPLAKATQVKHILDRPLMPHERSNSPPETILPSVPTTSPRHGSLRIPSWWMS